MKGALATWSIAGALRLINQIIGLVVWSAVPLGFCNMQMSLTCLTLVMGGSCSLGLGAGKLAAAVLVLISFLLFWEYWMQEWEIPSLVHWIYFPHLNNGGFLAMQFCRVAFQDLPGHPVCWLFHYKYIGYPIFYLLALFFVAEDEKKIYSYVLHLLPCLIFLHV